MGAYLVAARGGVRHAFLLGVVVTITHTIVIFLLAVTALWAASSHSSDQVARWLEVASAVLVIAVGVWMTLTAFGLIRRRPGTISHPHGHDHPHGPHAHDHADQGHDDGHTHHHAVRSPEGRNPLGFWTLLGVGASGGLVPCPAALTALLAAVHLGRPALGAMVVGAMSVGIAVTLIGIGIMFVQAGRMASRVFGSRGIAVYVPRASAVVILLLGVSLLVRMLLEGPH